MCFPSVRTIAAEMHLSTSTVQSAVDRLVGAGLLRVVASEQGKRAKRPVNRYLILSPQPSSVSNSDTVEEPGVSEFDTLREVEGVSEFATVSNFDTHDPRGVSEFATVGVSKFATVSKIDTVCVSEFATPTHLGVSEFATGCVENRHVTRPNNYIHTTTTYTVPDTGDGDANPIGDRAAVVGDCLNDDDEDEPVAEVATPTITASPSQASVAQSIKDRYPNSYAVSCWIKKDLGVSPANAKYALRFAEKSESALSALSNACARHNTTLTRWLAEYAKIKDNSDGIKRAGCPLCYVAAIADKAAEQLAANAPTKTYTATLPNGGVLTFPTAEAAATKQRIIDAEAATEAKRAAMTPEEIAADQVRRAAEREKFDAQYADYIAKRDDAEQARRRPLMDTGEESFTRHSR
jgi:hypothetical protein